METRDAIESDRRRLKYISRNISKASEEKILDRMETPAKQQDSALFGGHLQSGRLASNRTTIASDRALFS